MGSLLDEEGFPIFANLSLTDGSENFKREKIRVRIRIIDKPAPTEKRMHILLTRDDDASFFYFLDISESDYRTLRQRQGLLVDISSFPSMLEGLLDACRKEESAPNPKFLPVLSKHHGPGSDIACFEIQETNAYRRLVHLSLEMCRGTDSRIREHLSERLVRVQSEFDQLSNNFRNVQHEMSAIRSEAVSLKNEVDKLRREKSDQESDFLSRLTNELSEERKRFQTEMASVKASYDSERRTIFEEHSRSMRQLQNQAASLEYENKDLTEKKHRYESTIQTLSEEKRLQTEEVNRIRRELERHREKNNFLGAGNHELDRNLNRLEAKVALLELEKTRLSEDTARQAQAIQDLTDQKKSLDSELQEKKNLVTKREEAVKNVSRELLKANDVIKKLQEQNRKLNQKVKLGYDVLQEQERLLSTKDSELEGVRQELKQQDEKVVELQESIRKLEHLLEDEERKMSEMAKKNRTDDAVIQWLNKQLTFAQSRDPGLRLGPPPEFLATSTPLPAASQYLRDMGMETPMNQGSRSTDKENSKQQRHGLDPKYLRPAISASAIEKPSPKTGSRPSSRSDASAAPSPTTAGLLRASALTTTTSAPLKSKNQQSVYFAKT